MTDIRLWIDVESTGVTFDDQLLQVACILTDTLDNEISQPHEWVVRHDNGNALRAASDPFVQAMHDHTGLWDRLATGTPLHQVDCELRDLVARHATNPRDVRVAGNSVRLDLNMMQAWLPLTYAHVHYRFEDMTGIQSWLSSRGFLGDQVYRPAQDKNHNAVDDIRQSLDQSRWMRKVLQERMLP